MGARVRRAVAPLLGTEAGRAELGVGAGGDRTVELDRAAESAALHELARVAERGLRFSVLSEEAGLIDLGAPYPLVLLDPVDGSLNAKQGLPVHAVMLSLLDGPALADLRLGRVLNLASGERWHAVRGGGAYRNGRRLEPLRSSRTGRIQVLGLESGSPRDLRHAERLLEQAGKVRMLGSMALALAHTAAGGIEVFCSPMPARVFDTTASLLMLREVGGVVTDMRGGSLDGARVSLDSRTTLLCSADAALHRLALDVLNR